MELILAHNLLRRKRNMPQTYETAKRVETTYNNYLRAKQAYTQYAALGRPISDYAMKKAYNAYIYATVKFAEK